MTAMAAACGTGTKTLAVAPATQLQRLCHSAGVAWMDSASAHQIEEWDSFTVKRASKSDLELARGWGAKAGTFHAQRQ